MNFILLFFSSILAISEFDIKRSNFLNSDRNSIIRRENVMAIETDRFISNIENAFDRNHRSLRFKTALEILNELSLGPNGSFVDESRLNTLSILMNSIEVSEYIERVRLFIREYSRELFSSEAIITYDKYIDLVTRAKQELIKSDILSRREGARLLRNALLVYANTNVDSLFVYRLRN